MCARIYVEINGDILEKNEQRNEIKNSQHYS